MVNCGDLAGAYKAKLFASKHVSIIFLLFFKIWQANSYPEPLMHRV